MKERNDWQAFYRQQVKVFGDLIRLPEVLPPRIQRLRDENAGDITSPTQQPSTKEISRPREVSGHKSLSFKGR